VTTRSPAIYIPKPPSYSLVNLADDGGVILTSRVRRSTSLIYVVLIKVVIVSSNVVTDNKDFNARVARGCR
jgi:hypothetical protein